MKMNYISTEEEFNFVIIQLMERKGVWYENTIDKQKCPSWKQIDTKDNNKFYRYFLLIDLLHMNINSECTFRVGFDG